MSAISSPSIRSPQFETFLKMSRKPVKTLSASGSLQAQKIKALATKLKRQITSNSLISRSLDERIASAQLSRSAMIAEAEQYSKLSKTIKRNGEKLLQRYNAQLFEVESVKLQRRPKVEKANSDCAFIEGERLSQNRKIETKQLTNQQFNGGADVHALLASPPKTVWWIKGKGQEVAIDKVVEEAEMCAEEGLRGLQVATARKTFHKPQNLFLKKQWSPVCYNVTKRQIHQEMQE